MHESRRQFLHMLRRENNTQMFAYIAHYTESSTHSFTVPNVYRLKHNNRNQQSKHGSSKPCLLYYAVVANQLGFSLYYFNVTAASLSLSLSPPTPFITTPPP